MLFWGISIKFSARKCWVNDTFKKVPSLSVLEIVMKHIPDRYSKLLPKFSGLALLRQRCMIINLTFLMISLWSEVVHVDRLKHVSVPFSPNISPLFVLPPLDLPFIPRMILAPFPTSRSWNLLVVFSFLILFFLYPICLLFLLSYYIWKIVSVFLYIIFSLKVFHLSLYNETCENRSLWWPTDIMVYV